MAGKNGNESSKQACKQGANYAIGQNKHTNIQTPVGRDTPTHTPSRYP